MSFKEELKKELYGGIYPFFWCNTVYIEKLHRILEEMGLRKWVIKSPTAIEVLTEEQAKRILEALRGGE